LKLPGLSSRYNSNSMEGKGGMENIIPFNDKEGKGGEQRGKGKMG
jgi:hypothetical protein